MHLLRAHAPYHPFRDDLSMSITPIIDLNPQPTEQVLGRRDHTTRSMHGAIGLAIIRRTDASGHVSGGDRCITPSQRFGTGARGTHIRRIEDGLLQVFLP